MKLRLPTFVPTLVPSFVPTFVPAIAILVPVIATLFVNNAQATLTENMLGIEETTSYNAYPKSKVNETASGHSVIIDIEALKISEDEKKKVNDAIDMLWADKTDQEKSQVKEFLFSKYIIPEINFFLDCVSPYISQNNVDCNLRDLPVLEQFIKVPLNELGDRLKLYSTYQFSPLKENKRRLSKDSTADKTYVQTLRSLRKKSLENLLKVNTHLVEADVPQDLQVLNAIGRITPEEVKSKVDCLTNRGITSRNKLVDFFDHFHPSPVHSPLSEKPVMQSIFVE